jgi:hypothetical protein
MVDDDNAAGRDRWRLAVYVSDTFSRSIEHADQKAALLSAAIGIIILAIGECQGQLRSTLHPNGPLAIVALGMLCVFAVLLSLSAVFVVLTLFPRMLSAAPSPFYFGDVARRDPEWLSDQLFEQRAPERLLVAGSQNLASIALAKHTLFRRAALAYGAALVPFLAWILVATIALPASPAPG